MVKVIILRVKKNIALLAGTGDESHLAIVGNHVPKFMDQVKPETIFY